MSRLVFGVLLLLLAGSTQAQSNYPEKSIRLMVGFPPGSSVFAAIIQIEGARWARVIKESGIKAD